MVDDHEFKHRVIVVLSWAARSFEPGSLRRTAADGLLSRMIRPGVAIVPGRAGSDGMDALLRYAEVASELNRTRLLRPDLTPQGIPALFEALRVEAEFHMAGSVTFEQIGWILSGHPFAGDLRHDIVALTGEMRHRMRIRDGHRLPMAA